MRIIPTAVLFLLLADVSVGQRTYYEKLGIYQSLAGDTFSIGVKKNKTYSQVIAHFSCADGFGVNYTNAGGCNGHPIYSYEVVTDSGWVDGFKFSYAVCDYLVEVTSRVNSGTFELNFTQKGTYRIKMVKYMSGFIPGKGVFDDYETIWYSAAFRIK
jgi:hypothetical protein